MTDLVYLGNEPKRCWLQEACNKYGDFKVCYSYINQEGEHKFTKHKSVLDLWQTDLKFLDKVNHRQILPHEIILDLDDKEAIDRFQEVCDVLDEKGETYYCFHTGSKGYHIHILDHKLVLMPENYVKKIRTSLYKLFSIPLDFHKSSSKVLIAMENTAHWKTGKTKNLVRKSRWLI